MSDKRSNRGTTLSTSLVDIRVAGTAGVAGVELAVVTCRVVSEPLVKDFPRFSAQTIAITRILCVDWFTVDRIKCEENQINKRVNYVNEIQGLRFNGTPDCQ